MENTVFKGCDVAPDSFTFICGWLNKKPLNPPKQIYYHGEMMKVKREVKTETGTGKQKHKIDKELGKHKKVSERPNIRILRDLGDLNLKRLYDLEKEAFKDNTNMILDYDVFKKMFDKDTIFAVVEKDGEYKGFIIANPINKSGYELDEYDEEQIKKKIGVDEFKRLKESIDKNKTYYIDDFASTDPHVTLLMLSDFNKQLKDKGVTHLTFHGRIKSKSDRILDTFFRHEGWSHKYDEVHEEHFGGEDFNFILMEKGEKRREEKTVQEEVRYQTRIDELRDKLQKDKKFLTPETIAYVEELTDKLNLDEYSKLKMQLSFIELHKKCVENGFDYWSVLEYGFGSIKDLITNENRFNKFIELGIKSVENGINYAYVLAGFYRIKSLIRNENDIIKYGDKLIELGIKCAENGVDYGHVLIFGFGSIEDLIRNENDIIKYGNKFIELGIKCAENRINYWYVLEYGFGSIKDLITNENRFNKFIELGTKCAENGIDYEGVLKWGFGIIKNLITNDNDIIKYGNKLIELGIKCAENGIDYRDVLKYGFGSIKDLIRNENDIIKYGDKFIELGIKCAENRIISYFVLKRLESIKDLITNENRFNKFIELGVKCAENGINYWLVLKYGFESVKDLITNDNDIIKYGNKFIELGIKCAENGIDYRDVLG